MSTQTYMMLATPAVPVCRAFAFHGKFLCPDSATMFLSWLANPGNIDCSTFQTLQLLLQRFTQSMSPFMDLDQAQGRAERP